jgi:hypothetical protein
VAPPNSMHTGNRATSRDGFASIGRKNQSVQPRNLQSAGSTVGAGIEGRPSDFNTRFRSQAPGRPVPATVRRRAKGLVFRPAPQAHLVLNLLQIGDCVGALFFGGFMYSVLTVLAAAQYPLREVMSRHASFGIERMYQLAEMRRKPGAQ